MNPTIQFMKKQGLKVFLPLLLLATACGEGTPSALQANDVSSPPVPEIVGAKPTSVGLASGVESTMPAPIVEELDLDPEDASTNKSVQPDVGSVNGVVALVPVTTMTKVPEPAAIAGLAMTALGLVAIKRKRVAA